MFDMCSNVLAGTPAAPLTVAGGMAVGGNFTVVANPNGGDLEKPLSIWTNDYVDLNTGPARPAIRVITPVAAVPISANRAIRSRISRIAILIFQPTWCGICSENDDAAGWANIESRANQIVNNCNGLGPTTTVGLVIVNGDCNPGSNIGTNLPLLC